MAWSAALVAALSPASSLKAGDGTLGTISTAEASAVTAGTTIEIATSFVPDSTFEGKTGAQQLADVDAWYASITGAHLTDLQHQLQRFGMVLT